ncbi:MAG: rhomboid family intramembrane serine protease [bacterium]
MVEFYNKHPGIDISDIKKDEFFPEIRPTLEKVKKRKKDKLETSFYKSERISLINEYKRAIQSLPFLKYGLIPRKPKIFNFLSCMFMHADIFHLLGNMIFLWAMGCAIEDKWGMPLYLGFYLIGGIMASLAHIFMSPNSIIPTIGASGAISGVMGAFLVRMFNTRMKMFYLWWWKTGIFYIPAYVFLPLDLALQFYYALSTPTNNFSGGVAFWAHIGGFIFGVIFAVIMKVALIEEKYIQPEIEQKLSLSQHPKLISAIEKLDQERFDEAITDLNPILKIDPLNPDSNTILARIYTRQNKIDKAVQVYKKLIPIYISEKNKEIALMTYFEMKDLAPDIVLSPKDQTNIARLLESENRIKEAAEAYLKLINKYPGTNETMKAMVNYGMICLNKINQPTEALKIFEKGIELCKLYPEWKNMIEDGLTRAKVAVDSLKPRRSKKFNKIEPTLSKPSTLVSQGENDSLNKNMLQIAVSEMNILRLNQAGIIFEDKDKHNQLFKWEQIKWISIASIDMGYLTGECQRLIDLIYNVDRKLISLVRIKEERIRYELVFKELKEARRQNFIRLVKVLLKSSKASADLPKNNDSNPLSFKYPDIKTYELNIIYNFS